MFIDKPGKLIRNAIKCLRCGDEIESRSRHDFVTCTCFKESNGHVGCYIDGGLDYVRTGGDPSYIEDLTEFDYNDIEDIDF